MVVFVLDASALLRWLDGDSGSTRVSEVFVTHLMGSNRVVMSAVHFGEVLGILLKRNGLDAVQNLSKMVETLRLEIFPVTLERAEASALLRFKFKLPYVDSYAAELAVSFANHALLTADFDFKPLEHDINIEFLPARQK